MKRAIVSTFLIAVALVVNAQIKKNSVRDTTIFGNTFEYSECEVMAIHDGDPVKAPLFRDPVQDGAADPIIIWNRAEQEWYMFYTVRRANVEAPGYAWVFGSDVGIASSKDGKRWVYRGTANFEDIARGHNTHWAPDVLYHDGTYHMYLSWHQGIPDNWWSNGRILHLTSKNLWDWKYESTLPLNSNGVIDAGVVRLDDGTWRMWYKDRCSGQQTWAADSEDLYKWKVRGEVISDEPHEGPYVFKWKGYYWMVTDPWRGLGLYRSKDADKWIKQGYLLDQPGIRKDDRQIGQHATVWVNADDRAFIFYHVHPGGSPMNWEGDLPYAVRRSSIQVAELKYEKGKITCDRNEEFSLDLIPPKD